MKPPRTLIAGFFALLFAPTGLAQNATVLGQVVDPKGQPVAGAKVTITLTTGSVPLNAETKTNDIGSFLVWGLPPGDYSYAVEADGYSKAIGGQLTLESSVELKVVLEPLPSDLPLIHVQQIQRIPQDIGVMLTPPPLERIVFSALPGFSYVVCAERQRPFQGLSTEELLEQFRRLRGGYREDERDAGKTANFIVGTLIARKHLSASIEKQLLELDRKYDTNLSSKGDVPPKDLFPHASNEDLRRQLNTKLAGYAHYLETLSGLRATVAELGRRHAFSAEQAQDYYEFLAENNLVTNELEVQLIEEKPIIVPLEMLDFNRGLQSSLNKSSNLPRIFVSHAGVALGFLEADPAVSTQQLEVGGSMKLSRKFVSISKNIADPSEVYKIDVHIDSNLPSDFEKVLPTAVQTIASNGQLNDAEWDFYLKTNKRFKPFNLRLRAELQEFSPGSGTPTRQPVEVPVSLVRIERAPGRLESWWAKLALYREIVLAVFAVLGFIVAISVVAHGGAEKLRDFLGLVANNSGAMVRRIPSNVKQWVQHIWRRGNGDDQKPE